MSAHTKSNPLAYSGSMPASIGRTAPAQAHLERWDWFSGPSAYRPSLGYRGFEIAVAAVMLVLSAPVILFVAMLVKLESRGPAFFVQTRMTTGCRPFRFVKLRTMYIEWDRRFPQLALAALGRQDAADIRLSMPEDPRVTPLGRWLRRTSLDELTNFWHVLTGDMALVGPRPEVPELLPQYRGKMLAKFSVRPGITGYAQIHGRGDLNFNSTIQYDLRYVQERSLAVDLRVLRQTIASVLLGRGAY